MRSPALSRIARLEEWSRRSSLLHSCDPRAKLVASLLLLLFLSLTPIHTSKALVLFFGSVLTLTALTSALAHLPFLGIVSRAAWVLPFSAFFALMLWLENRTLASYTLLLRSWASAMVVVLLTATTPLERMLAGLESMRVPRLLLDVVHFTWRYLFVIAGQAQRMRMAAQIRGGRGSLERAGAALAVLFARSYQRAENLHRAMLARGYGSPGILLHPLRPGWGDMLLVTVAAAAGLLIRVLVGRQ